MKSARDPRHQKRRKIVKELFAASFTEQDALPKTKAILKKRTQIDKQIAAAAPTWPLAKINKIDLAILRLAVYELSEGKTPKKVAIDEAVELAKEFGSETSAAFINGVLGAIVEKGLKDSKKENGK